MKKEESVQEDCLMLNRSVCEKAKDASEVAARFLYLLMFRVACEMLMRTRCTPHAYIRFPRNRVLQRKRSERKKVCAAKTSITSNARDLQVTLTGQGVQFGNRKGKREGVLGSGEKWIPGFFFTSCPAFAPPSEQRVTRSLSWLPFVFVLYVRRKAGEVVGKKHGFPIFTLSGVSSSSESSSLVYSAQRLFLHNLFPS